MLHKSQEKRSCIHSSSEVWRELKCLDIHVGFFQARSEQGSIYFNSFSDFSHWNYSDEAIQHVIQANFFHVKANVAVAPDSAGTDFS